MPDGSAYDADVPRNKPLKQLVAENVRALMTAKKLKQNNVAALAKLKGHDIDQTTVGRIARAAIPTTVDKLDALAAGLGVEPWQLLVAELDPAKLPRLGADLTKDQRELISAYDAASGRWKIAMRYMAGLQRDAQQEEAVGYLLSKIFATPVPDEKVEAAYGFPPGRPPIARVKEGQRVHEPRPQYNKIKKTTR